MMKRIIGLFIFIMILYSCQNTNNNTFKFNRFIEKAYRGNDSIIDFDSIFPFEWDRMYIFNREHYPEADNQVVSEIAGVNYQGNKRWYDNRLILFTKGKEVVFDVLTDYKSDDFSKNFEPFKVNFYITKETPVFFTREDSRFIINQYYISSSYLLTWHPKKNPPASSGSLPPTTHK